MEGRWKNAALYVNQSTVDLDDTGPQSLATLSVKGSHTGLADRRIARPKVFSR